MTMGKSSCDIANISASIFDKVFHATKQRLNHSGVDQHTAGDFRAVFVQTKRVSGSNGSKRTFMVVAKLKQFGDNSHWFPLNWAWSTNRGVFCASIFILGVKSRTYEEIECLRSLEKIISTLMKVDSSCILPISPTLVRTGKDVSDPAFHNILTIVELTIAFEILVLRGNHHVAKDNTIYPVQVDNM